MVHECKWYFNWFTVTYIYIYIYTRNTICSTIFPGEMCVLCALWKLKFDTFILYGFMQQNTDINSPCSTNMLNCTLVLRPCGLRTRLAEIGICNEKNLFFDCYLQSLKACSFNDSNAHIGVLQLTSMLRYHNIAIHRLHYIHTSNPILII